MHVSILAAAGLLSFGLMACASSAQADGAWVLNPALCADLREDVRDARVTTGPGDRREDRRDRRYVNCPARAFSYVGPRGRAVPARPTYSRIYVDPRGRYFGARGGRTVRIVVR